MNHSPTPWRHDEHIGTDIILDANGTALTHDDLYCPTELSPADMSHIVHCVNCHDELVAACRAAKNLLSPVISKTPEHHAELTDARRLLDAAIAKASDPSQSAAG